jgi:hypothetical protein
MWRGKGKTDRELRNNLALDRMAITNKVKGRFRITGSTGSDADGRRGKREPDNSEGYHNIRVRRVTPEEENEPVEKAAGNKKGG